MKKIFTLMMLTLGLWAAGAISAVASPTWPVSGKTYKVKNPSRGYLYYSPNNSALFVWATGKNDSKPAAANYQWVFEPIDEDAHTYYIYSVGRGRYIEPTYGSGDYTQSPGYTWTFTPNKVAVKLEQVGTSDNFSIRTLSGNIYLSISPTYNGPVISYYASGDAGVPFAVEAQGSVTSAIETAMENATEPFLSTDVSFTQGFQTTGQGNTDQWLVRMNVTGYGDNYATIDQLKVKLDATTASNISALKIYKADGTEWNAISKTLLATVSAPQSGENVVSLSGCSLGSGVNRIYVAADVKSDATVGDAIDASITSMTYTPSGGSQQTITLSGNPSGSATIYPLQRFLFVPTTNSCNYYRIPAMIVADNGDIIAAADMRYNSNADLGGHKIDVAIRRSSDGGQTWTDLQKIAVGDGSSKKGYGYGDPALVKAQDGTIICLMAAGQYQFQSGNMKYAAITKSTDNGKTWSSVRQLFDSNFTDEISGTTNSCGSAFNSLFVSSGKGLTTSDGKLMFLTVVSGVSGYSGYGNYIMESDDDGETWALKNNRVFDGADEAKLEQMNDGQLLASVRCSGNRGFNKGSADGTTWDTQWTNSGLWGNSCNADILYYSRSADGDKDILLHTLPNNSQRMNLCLYMSTNEGETWTKIKTIQTGSAGYSTMVKLSDGSVAILFEDGSAGAYGYHITLVTVSKEEIEAAYEENHNDNEANYSAANKVLENGAVYQISTVKNGTTYYLHTTNSASDGGTLTTSASEATNFVLSKTSTAGYMGSGWRIFNPTLYLSFTNPTTSDGAVSNDGAIHTALYSQNDRDDYEAQVLLYDGEKFAVRATNVIGSTYGEGAYWTITSANKAGYATTQEKPEYIWNFTKVGDAPSFDDNTVYRIKAYSSSATKPFIAPGSNGAAMQKTATEDDAAEFYITKYGSEANVYLLYDLKNSLYMQGQNAAAGTSWKFQTGQTTGGFRIMVNNNSPNMGNPTIEEGMGDMLYSLHVRGAQRSRASATYNANYVQSSLEEMTSEAVCWYIYPIGTNPFGFTPEDGMSYRIKLEEDGRYWAADPDADGNLCTTTSSSDAALYTITEVEGKSGYYYMYDTKKGNYVVPDNTNIGGSSAKEAHWTLSKTRTEVQIRNNRENGYHTDLMLYTFGSNRAEPNSVYKNDASDLTVGNYQQAKPNRTTNHWYIEGVPTGITTVKESKQGAERYYDLSGRRIASPQQGIVIVKSSDGKVSKVRF